MFYFGDFQLSAPLLRIWSGSHLANRVSTARLCDFLCVTLVQHADSCSLLNALQCETLTINASIDDVVEQEDILPPVDNHVNGCAGYAFEDNSVTKNIPEPEPDTESGFMVFSELKPTKSGTRYTFSQEDSNASQSDAVDESITSDVLHPEENQPILMADSFINDSDVIPLVVQQCCAMMTDTTETKLRIVAVLDAVHRHAQQQRMVTQQRIQSTAQHSALVALRKRFRN